MRANYVSFFELLFIDHVLCCGYEFFAASFMFYYEIIQLQRSALLLSIFKQKRGQCLPSFKDLEIMLS